MSALRGLADFLCLIEAAPPLAPPVQGNRNDDLRRIVDIQMVCQQAGKQRREQDLTGILQPGMSWA